MTNIYSGRGFPERRKNGNGNHKSLASRSKQDAEHVLAILTANRQLNRRQRKILKRIKLNFENQQSFQMPS